MLYVHNIELSDVCDNDRMSISKIILFYHNTIGYLDIAIKYNANVF